MSDKESSVSKGFGIGVGILLAHVLISLILLFLAAIFAPERLEALRRGAFLHQNSTIGTPGSGYVLGAPRTPQECIKRGGSDTGRGCSGYQ